MDFVREWNALFHCGHSRSIVGMFEAVYVRETTELHLVLQGFQRSLKQELARRGRMNFADASAVMKQVVDGVHHLHCLGFMHRDLKPQNCLVNDSGKVVVSDLGTTRRIDDDRCYTLGTTTVWYESPETLLGNARYGPEVDIWALGCMHWELRTEKVLFPSDYTKWDQLRLIFQKLGTPDEHAWPGIATLPNWSASFPRFRAVPPYEWEEHVAPPPRTTRARALTGEECTLLEEMLRLRPSERVDTAALTRAYGMELPDCTGCTDPRLAMPPPAPSSPEATEHEQIRAAPFHTPSMARLRAEAIGATLRMITRVGADSPWIWHLGVTLFDASMANETGADASCAAMSALYLASKLEEVAVMSIHDFPGESRAQILATERCMLMHVPRAYGCWRKMLSAHAAHAPSSASADSTSLSLEEELMFVWYAIAQFMGRADDARVPRTCQTMARASTVGADAVLRVHPPRSTVADPRLLVSEFRAWLLHADSELQSQVAALVGCKRIAFDLRSDVRAVLPVLLGYIHTRGMYYLLIVLVQTSKQIALAVRAIGRKLLGRGLRASPKMLRGLQARNAMAQRSAGA